MRCWLGCSFALLACAARAQAPSGSPSNRRSQQRQFLMTRPLSSESVKRLQYHEPRIVENSWLYVWPLMLKAVKIIKFGTVQIIIITNMMPTWFQNDPTNIPKWFQNDPKLLKRDPKTIQNWFQHILKWSQTYTKMIPKWCQQYLNFITK